MIQFHCHCGQALQAPAGSGGKLATCPKCHHKLKVPMDPDAIVAKCPKCDHFVVREAYDIHVEGCQGTSAPAEKSV